ncbi:hypothetical protein GCM10010381_10040 [Streptomyces xantholiticus]|nr:hypothetical protein GCM10010381_10040 [Streptomyces xantholiticus]
MTRELDAPGRDGVQGPDVARRPDDVRRHELAAFPRSRRGRITPEQVGRPRGPRRRTPGLRREEVAQLSAVGVTWYTGLGPPQLADTAARRATSA